MSEQYSIAQARHDLAALVRRLEEQPQIEITRRGKTVAVLLSLQEYRRLSVERKGFWQAYADFCAGVDLSALDITPDVFDGVRSLDPGRDVRL